MKDLTQYVDPYIGSIGHLLTATSPNVQSPHGAAIVAPVFAPGVMDYYTSDKIYGFRAGSGILMPTLNQNSFDFYETASIFDHDLETAKPHCYEVLLEDYDITERHTALENYGAFEFSFPDAEQATVMLYVKNCSEYKIEGNRIYADGVGPVAGNKPSRVRTMYEFSALANVEIADIKTPNGYRSMIEEETKAFRITLKTDKASILFVNSVIGFDACDLSYKTKVKGKTFSQIKDDCQSVWNALLSKIEIEGSCERDKSTFYTALYRSVARMHNYSENGVYYGYDGAVHDDGGSAFYCDDGIWDTYRCMHPLQLILEPKVHQDIVNSYLRMYQQSGWLPRFPYTGGNVPCMLGHHGVALLADSLAKDVEFDLSLAYEAAHKNATQRTMLPWKDGEADELTKIYYEKGFFPGLEEDEEDTFEGVHEFENRQSVAVTMEHAYDDWCVAQLAARLGKHDEAAFFLKRSKNYLNVFNPETGFVHPKKADGSFTKRYNPKLCGGQGGRMYFAENNAYIYNFNVQHDPEGLIEMFGGKEKFTQKLDNLFIEQYEVPKYFFLKQFPDATGLIGQYCQGNEPSFHIPYLYNYAGQAYKTQRRIREIIKLWYNDTPFGICGDEDGGAMSSWFVFSAMGFYPMCPGTDVYDLGSPIFDKSVIDLQNGKTFTILAPGACEGKKYIQSAMLNGVAHNKPSFTHADMMNGGTLELVMSERPNKAFGI